MPMSPDPLQTGDALFLDFDGTIVEVAEHPESVAPAVQLPSLLDRVRTRLGGALAIVSGRRLADVDRWLAPFRFAGAGVHGSELRRRPADRIETETTVDLGEAMSVAGAALAPFAGVWIEDKGNSLALHYRAMPEAADACISLAGDVAARFGLRALHGKMVVELKPDGVDKGRAVRELMSSPPFAARRPVFLGDDVTDEDGFAAAAALGGFGVRIGPGGTSASFRLPDVAAAIEWIGRPIAESST